MIYVHCGKIRRWHFVSREVSLIIGPVMPRFVPTTPYGFGIGWAMRLTTQRGLQ
jgi:hypothetical protein